MASTDAKLEARNNTRHGGITAHVVYEMSLRIMDFINFVVWYNGPTQIKLDGAANACATW